MIAMRYLFWNTHKNEQINPVLCDLIIENGISVVVLAEYSADMNDLIEEYREEADGYETAEENFYKNADQ